MLYYTRPMLVFCIIHYTKIVCIITIYVCNVLQFVKQFFIICVMLHVICCRIYIYKLHMCMWAQTRDVYSVWRVVLE